MEIRSYRWITEHEFIDAVAVYVEYYNRVVQGRIDKIPAPPLKDLQKVGSIVEAIDGSIFGRPKYPTFERKLAVAYYEINKGHYFVNGNKRLATYMLLYLLRLNRYTLPLQEWELVDLALRVARSKGTTRSRSFWINRITELLEDERRHWTERLYDD